MRHFLFAALAGGAGLLREQDGRDGSFGPLQPLQLDTFEAPLARVSPDCCLSYAARFRRVLIAVHTR